MLYQLSYAHHRESKNSLGHIRFAVKWVGQKCLSSIILSPLNGYVKMSPYETGDLCIEPERIATSSSDFVLLGGEVGVCQCRLTAPPNASTCQTTQIPVTAR